MGLEDIRAGVGTKVRDSTLRKREAIVEAAMRLFAERGYEGTHVHHVAAKLGIAKGSVFQHFDTKEALFLAAYRQAILSFPRWLEAPSQVREEGFFATLRYWLGRTEATIRDDWVPNRIALLGNNGTDLQIKREINRFLAEEDPYGTMDFVRFGIERGEVRTDIDPEMIAAMVDWLWERFQDSLVAEEIDPGLFRRHGDRQRRVRTDQFLELLWSAVRAPGKEPLPGTAQRR
jgi:TetR/AcrR family transcriptional regulator